MKKILIPASIFLIIIISSAGYYFYSEMENKNNPVILVMDGRKIRADELRAYRPEGKPCEKKDKCLDRFIDMQLLISEGLKAKLEKNEALKNIRPDEFNERLAKLALDKKIDSIDARASKEELDSYVNLHKGSITYTTYRYDDIDSARSGGNPSGITQTLEFEKIHGPRAYMMGILNPGEKTMPFKAEDHCYEIIQLDMVEQNLANIESIGEKEKKQIRTKLEEDKKLYILEKWKSELRDNANIKMTEELKKIF